MKAWVWGSVFCVALTAGAKPVFDESSTVLYPKDLPTRDLAVSTAHENEFVSVDRLGNVKVGEAPAILTGKFASGASSGSLFFNPLGSIIGDDERVNVADTSALPYRVIGRLSIGCTGTLVGPRHVLTAGHCLYNIRSDQWYSTLKFAPGQSAAKKLPNGDLEYEKAYAPRGWVEDHNARQDYGMLVLKENIGDKIGYLGYASGDLSLTKDITVSGYPADKDRGTVWESTCKIDNADDEKVYYDCDTFGGHSGSAVRMNNDKGVTTIRAVHGYGGFDLNSGARINDTVFAQIQKWIQENP